MKQTLIQSVLPSVSSQETISKHKSSVTGVARHPSIRLTTVFQNRASCNDTLLSTSVFPLRTSHSPSTTSYDPLRFLRFFLLTDLPILVINEVLPRYLAPTEELGNGNMRLRCAD